MSNASHRAPDRATIESHFHPPAYVAPVGPRPGKDWLTFDQAKAILEIRSLSSQDMAGLEIVQCKSNLSGRPPLMLRRLDVDRIAALRREAKCGLTTAIRIVVAENEGRLPPPQYT